MKKVISTKKALKLEAKAFYKKHKADLDADFKKIISKIKRTICKEKHKVKITNLKSQWYGLEFIFMKLRNKGYTISKTENRWNEKTASHETSFWIEWD